MQFILAAILVVLGAGPLSDCLLASPSYSRFLWDFQESVAIKSMLGHPDWLLTGAFLLACYGAAGVLLCAARASMPARRYVCSDATPFQRSQHGNGQSLAKSSHPAPK